MSSRSNSRQQTSRDEPAVSSRPPGATARAASAAARGKDSKPPPTDDPPIRGKEAPPPKIVLDKPLDARFTNYRGYTRCKYCSVLIVPLEMSDHLQTCALVPMRCELHDTETGEPCHQITRGRQLMAEHQQQCPMHTQPCTNAGCDRQVSIQSMAFHLQRCNFMPVECTSCRKTFLRSDFDVHQKNCAEEIVPCPLGCDSSMRRGDVLSHVHNTAATHLKFCAHHDSSSIPDDDHRAVFAALVKRISELEDRIGHVILQTTATAVPARSPSPSPQPAATSTTATTAHKNQLPFETTMQPADSSQQQPSVQPPPITPQHRSSEDKSLSTVEHHYPKLNLKPLATLAEEEQPEYVAHCLNDLQQLIDEKHDILRSTTTTSSDAVLTMRSEVCASYDATKCLVEDYLTSDGQQQQKALPSNQTPRAHIELLMKDVGRAMYDLKCDMYDRLWGEK